MNCVNTSEDHPMNGIEPVCDPTLSKEEDVTNHQIISATWSLEDWEYELQEILKGTSAELLEQRLMRYVEQKIEPAGWRAIWRFSGGTILDQKLYFPIDFLVYVLNVSQESLHAWVIITSVISSKSIEGKNLAANFSDKEVFVPLTELYSHAEQENKIIDIETTTEILDQIRFIYDNILLPWDMYEEWCCFDKELIASRLEVYENKRKGIISKDVCKDMKALKEKGKAVAKEIKDIEQNCKMSDGHYIDQRDIARLTKLHKELEQLKNKYNALKDPTIRELTLYQEQLERKNILSSSFSEEPANVLVVSSSVPLDEFSINIAKLPDLLKQLPKVLDVPRVKTFSSLQIALDAAQASDVIAIMPGSHQIRQLGNIANGGAIVGFGDEVEIYGSSETGDILLDLNLSKGEIFVLKSLVLKPLLEQTVVFLHGESLIIDNCTFKGGFTGISLLDGSNCKVKKSKLSHFNSWGIECKAGSNLSLKQVKFDNCFKSAMKCEKGSKVTVEDDVCLSECQIGVTLANVDGSVSENDLKSRVLNCEEEIKFSNVAKKYDLV